MSRQPNTFGPKLHSIERKILHEAYNLGCQVVCNLIPHCSLAIILLLGLTVRWNQTSRFTASTSVEDVEPQ